MIAMMTLIENKIATLDIFREKETFFILFETNNNKLQ